MLSEYVEIDFVLVRLSISYGCNSWSRHSRYVLTSSKDWNIITWDLLSNDDPIQRHATIRFDAPVMSASFHPRNRYAHLAKYCPNAWKLTIHSQIILALLGTGEAYLVDKRKENRGQVELCEVQDESEDEGEGQMNRTRYVGYRFIHQEVHEWTIGNIKICTDRGPL